MDALLQEDILELNGVMEKRGIRIEKPPAENPDTEDRKKTGLPLLWKCLLMLAFLFSALTFGMVFQAVLQIS